MPENQKAENLLNLSLEATDAERLASPVLRAGTDAANERWEVIVKFHGDLSRIAGEDIRVEILSAGYGIVTLPKRYIEALAALEEIEFVEKPKRLYADDASGNYASCIYDRGVIDRSFQGQGICIGIIDSGLSYEMPAFRNPDGTTRVLYYYDQVQGREYTKEELDEILTSGASGGAEGPTFDRSGHGTAVAAIAAGNGRQTDGSVNINLMGVAPMASLIIVKLDTGANESFPLTTSLMRAMDYVVKQALSLQMPLAVNLSFGNTYGAHDGTDLLERFIDNLSEIGRTVICVGSGNEGAAGGHASGIIDEGEEERVIEFTIGAYEREFNLQLWLNYVDTYEVTLRAPGGSSFTLDTYVQIGSTLRSRLGTTNLLIYAGAPKPYSVDQEVFFDFIPGETYIDQGVWQLILRPTKLVSGNYSLYMPSSQIKGRDTRFLQPALEQTLTIPSTAERVITVGAYDALYNTYADFSGRGFVTRLSAGNIRQVKPEIAAPGVGILAENSYGLQRLDGTSYATPFVTGAAAILMESAILSGTDPYLYGEKMKAQLCRQAKPLLGVTALPNDQTGWGGLCIR